MIKDDTKSIEELAFLLNRKDIAHLSRSTQLLKEAGLLSLSDTQYEQLRRGIRRVNKLMMHEKVYAFHTTDDYVEVQDTGIELFLRRGDSIAALYQCPDRGHVPDIEEIIRYLKDAKINEVYTGEIPPEGFFGIMKTADEENPITREKLGDVEIQRIRKAKIKVITLDSLV
jgi:hypothetical protein